MRWLHGIEIDVCQQCQGIWLDAGELRQIIINHRQPKLAAVTLGAVAPPHHAAAGQSQSRWYDGVEIPLPGDADFLIAIGNGLGDLASSGVDVAKPVLEFLGEALSLLDW